MTITVKLTLQSKSIIDNAKTRVRLHKMIHGVKQYGYNPKVSCDFLLTIKPLENKLDQIRTQLGSEKSASVNIDQDQVCAIRNRIIQRHSEPLRVIQNHFELFG